MAVPDPMVSHRALPFPSVGRERCTAYSKQTGNRCGQIPAVGAAVCRFHGGAAPQVQKAARDRIAEMVDPALSALRNLVDTADQDSVRLSAIKDILDRAGFKPTEKMQTDGSVKFEFITRAPDDLG